MLDGAFVSSQNVNCSVWEDDFIYPMSSMCGNGMLDGQEQCDDNNSFPNDGCSSNCTVEPGYICCTTSKKCTCKIIINDVLDNLTSNCSTMCGDGETAYLKEECDDDNVVSGDGCSSNCTLEKGFNCTQNFYYTYVCDFLYLLDLNETDGQRNLDISSRIITSSQVYLIDPILYDFVLINNTLVSL